MATKWIVAAVLVALCVWLLVRASTSSERWVRHDAQASTGATLTIAADAPVRGWTRSAFPTLIIRCDREAGLGVALSTGLPLEVEKGDARSVSVQFDNGPPELRHWIVSSDRQRLTVPPAEAQELLTRLPATKRMAFTFVPLRAEPVVGRFSVKGFSRYWEGIRSFCS